MSTNPEHIKENWNIFDFKLTNEEVEQITGLKKQLIFTKNFEEKLKFNEKSEISLTD